MGLTPIHRSKFMHTKEEDILEVTCIFKCKRKGLWQKIQGLKRLLGKSIDVTTTLATKETLDGFTP